MTRIISFANILLLCILFSVNADCQVKVLTRPDSYESPTGEFEKVHPITRSGNKLAVMVDRSNTPYYSDETGSNEIGKLKFREIFYVIGEKGDFFHLAKRDVGPNEDIPKFDEKNTTTLKNPIIVGWVRKNNLLPWQYALCGKNKFFLKALPLARNADVVLNPQKYVGDKSKAIMCYNNPNNSGSNASEAIQLGMFNIFYIYKKERVQVNGSDKIMYLIGSNNYFSYTATSEIRGWVSQDVLYMWDNRVCIQPEFTENIDEREKAKAFAYAFSDPKDAVNYKKGNDAILLDTINDKDNTIIPWQAIKYRLPILENNKEDDVLKVGYKSKIVTASGAEVDEAKKAAIEERIKQMRNINVVITFDAQETSISTKLVSSCFDEIYRSYKERADDKFNINFAFVAYGAEEGKIIKSDFSSELNSIKNQLFSKVNFDEAPKETSNLENAFLESAKLFERNGRKDHSNYLILLGGRGASELLHREAIKNAYNVSNLNVFAYQLANQDHWAYESFTQQVYKIIEDGNNSIFSPNSKTINPLTGQPYPLKKFRLVQETSSNTKFKTWKVPKDDGFINFSEITYPSQSGLTLDDKLFERDISKFIDEATSTIQTGVEALQNSIVAKKSISSFVLNHLNRIKNITPDEKKNILNTYGEGNFEFFGDVYVPKNLQAEGVVMYEKVVFMTAEELDHLIEQLRAFDRSDVVDESAYRKSLYEYFRKVISSFYGEKDVDKLIKNMKPADVFKLMTDIDAPTRWKAIELPCILSKSCSDYNDIMKMGEKIKSKKEGLNKAKGNPKYMWSPDNGAVYYWLPISLIP